MSHRTRRPINNECYPEQLLHAIGKFLPSRGLSLISTDHRIRWTDRLLVVTAIVMAWADHRTLRAAFAFARSFVVRMYPTRRRPGKQFRGFMRSLERAHDELLPKVTAGLRSAMERIGLLRRLQGRWMVLGGDGTRIACPRTVDNEEAFGVFGKSKSYPQRQRTTLFHVDSALPWTWRHGRGDTSERTHLREMMDQLPERTLLLADAGFVGFDLMRSLRQAGHDFIIRAGHNVHLLRKLGYEAREYDGIVYLWPQGRRSQCEPLVLRLVTVHDGRKRVYLLTSVLDPTLLSDSIVASLYRRRWGVEVLFRSLKQTMGKMKLRSRAGRYAQVEVDWSLVGLWLLGLMVLESTGTRRTIDCERGWSVAEALAVVRECITTRRQKTRRIRKMLAQALVDDYVRAGPKSTRSHRRKKSEPPAGKPKLRTAMTKERRAAQGFKHYKLAS